MLMISIAEIATRNGCVSRWRTVRRVAGLLHWRWRS